jgi:hypothetical protein
VKLSKISSVITIVAISAVSIPAHAQVFNQQQGGLFAQNNVADPNGGVRDLGTQASWIDTQILKNNPQAFCDYEDKSLGHNTASSQIDLTQSGSNYNDFNKDSSNRDGGGGGGSYGFGLISAKGNGYASNVTNNNGSSGRDFTNHNERTTSNSTVRVGKKVACGSFVQSAAARDMNLQDNLTKRYAIKMNRTAEQVNAILTPPRR